MPCWRAHLARASNYSTSVTLALARELVNFLKKTVYSAFGRIITLENK